MFLDSAKLPLLLKNLPLTSPQTHTLKDLCKRAATFMSRRDYHKLHAPWMFSDIIDENRNWYKFSKSNFQIALKFCIVFDSITSLLKMYSKELIMDVHPNLSL